MAEIIAERDPNRCPTHPGEILTSVIPVTGKSKSEIAALLGISRRHLYDIIKERRPVSPEVAVRLGKMFGDGADVWLRMQAAYDIWSVEQKLREEIKKVPTLVSGIHILTEEERALIANSRAGEFASDEAVAAFWKRFSVKGHQAD